MLLIYENKKSIQKTIQLNQKTPMDFIFIEGGTFDMGGESWNNDSSKPVHKVKLDDFWMAKYPTTQAQWKAIIQMANQKGIAHSLSDSPSRFVGNEDRPVEQVSWNDCQSFMQLSSEVLQDYHLRLPTEAQWEYAARGGIFSKGDDVYSGGNEIDTLAWYRDNSFGQTMPVGLKMPNYLGLYDMTGNVWEWCEDKYDGNYYKLCEEQNIKSGKIVENPVNRKSSTTLFVFRGGAYFLFTDSCAVRYRAAMMQSLGATTLAFVVF
ncbi:MAG: formylglycine-generating enzyme family protein [Cytophagia bacterium]|nr:MAG: formylglycine-generating enzyme family protein [Cytophagia bacterium]